MPHNAATNRPYSGVNIPILWGAALAGGYDRHLWMTYKQALSAASKASQAAEFLRAFSEDTSAEENELAA
jgi:antirestriction protein ArdC